MENEFVKVTILSNGSVEMLDKKTGKVTNEVVYLMADEEENQEDIVRLTQQLMEIQKKIRE